VATLGADGDPVNVSSPSRQQRPPRAAEPTTLLALLLGLVWLAALVFIRPLDAFPLFDDWVYSWSAFRFASGQGMAVPEWSSVYPLAHAAWGAAFVAVLGAEDWVLRLSTIALAALGHLCWYRLLSDLGLRPRWALLAVAATAFHPIYYLLTLSFMTDVPMVALWQIGLYAAWRWLRDDSALWQLAAVSAGLGAAYVRQTGAALLLGLLAAALVRRGRPQSAREPLLPVAAICLVLAGVFAFGADVGEGLPMTARLADLLAAVRVAPWVYIDGIAVALAFVGLSVAPFALGRSDDRWFVGVALGLLGIWIVGEAPTLRNGTMWGACELGGAASLLTGQPTGCWWAMPMRALALVASAVGWSALGPALTRRLSQVGYTHARDAREQFTLAAVVSFVGFALGLVALWLFADRYWLAPAVLAPALLLMDQPPSRPAWTSTALLGYALIAVLGTASVFDFYRAVDAQRLAAEAQGRAPHEIDAGYAQNGRYRYLALPKSRTNEGRNKDLPWVTGIAASKTTITNGASGPLTITSE
jgi:hypothetical protein